MLAHRWRCANCGWVNHVSWAVSEALVVMGAAMVGVLAFYFLTS